MGNFFKRKVFVYLIGLVMFISCSNPKTVDVAKENDGGFLQAKTSPSYAEGFNIIRKRKYTVVNIYNLQSNNELAQRFFLYSVAKKPKAIPANAVALRVPVKRIAVSSLDNVGFLAQLNCIRKVVALSDVNRLYNAKLKMAVENGDVVNLGPSVSLNIEKLLLAKPDVVFATSYSSAGHQREEKTHIPFVYNLDWMEKTPLGRAEWIKLIGEFTGKSKEADSIFRLIEKNYNSLKNKTSKLKNKPSVLVGANYKDVWYQPAGGSFKALLLRDAGASYFYNSDTTGGSLALSFEKVVEYQHDADFWIEAPFLSYRDMTAADSRYSIFKAVKTKNVYNNFGRAEGQANDYWETGMCRPDLLLKDLAAIFHPQIFDYKTVFYKKLKDE